MRDVKTRLERLEQASSAEIRCIWLYVGWDGYGCPRDAGDGVHRVFIPTLPPALPPGLFVTLRHPDRVGAEVSAEAADGVLKQLTLSPRQRSLIAQAKVLVLVTAGGPEPPPEAAAAAVAPPEAEAGPPPAVEDPPPPAAEEPPPPAVTPPPPAPPQWPEWLPR